MTTTLEVASKISEGRSKDYGHVSDNWANITDMVNQYLFMNGHIDEISKGLKPHQWGEVMALMKMCRNAHKVKCDNFVDATAYLALSGDVAIHNDETEI